MKKNRLFFILPVALGMALGQLVINSKEEKNRSREIIPPSGREEKSLAAFSSSNQLVSDYLLKSQALFSKAIETSQTNSGKENNRVVELINEAITQATEATIVSPQDARGWAQRGKIYKTIESYLAEALPTALKDYQQAIRLDPRQLDYYRQASEILIKLNHTNEAVAMLKSCVYINPIDPQGWYELARLQTSLGMIWEAQDSYRQVLPLLADQEKRDAVKTELTALEKLIAQAGEKPPTPSPTGKKEIILPDQPPKIEARAIAGVIIASPEEEAGSIEQTLSSNALSGTAIIPTGEKELTIENANLKVNSQVYLAEETNLENRVLRVKAKSAAGEKEPGWFSVEISAPLENEVKFRWWIIN